MTRRSAIWLAVALLALAFGIVVARRIDAFTREAGETFGVGRAEDRLAY